jgi:inosine-uridine nucleoside N-ribohydrolase
VKVHLDTDIGGDTDDLCARALLLGTPEVELVGITTCADAEGRRRSFAEHALRLAGRSGIPVATGARGFLGGLEHFPGVQDARYWPDLEELPPTPSDRALELLEASAMAGATIVAMGPYSNLALLQTLRPGAFAHCPVVTMGGYLGLPASGYPQWPASYDYNVQADRVAARIVYEKLNPLIVSLNVTLATALRRSDVPALEAGGPLARLIARQAQLHCQDNKFEALAAASPRLPSDLQNFQYDSAAVAAALGWDCLGVSEETLALIEDGPELRFQADLSAPARRLVTSIDGPAFAVRWLETVRNL